MMNDLKSLADHCLLVCEERLKGMNGHFCERNRVVCKLHESVGDKVAACGHWEMQPDIRN
jgi:hypothetical protein